MKKIKNSIFIATSLDGYIADKDGGIDWLHAIPNPDNIDMGYVPFIKEIDALVMGRNTFETVCSFDIDWPYTKPVYVLSNRLNTIPEAYQDKAQLVKGDLAAILDQIHQQGHDRIYIDGGATIQSFLKEDLIDEMIITVIPTLLGGGDALFGPLEKPLNFELLGTKVFLNQLVQYHYRRKDKED